MRNQGMVFLAVFIILSGVFLLIGNILNINLWAFCFPIGLIVLGLFLILRPRMVGPDTRSEVILIGDLDRSGPSGYPSSLVLRCSVLCLGSPIRRST